MVELKCDINDGYYILARKVDFEDTRKQNIQYILDIFGKNNISKPVASKIIPWPSNEDGPTELIFSNEDGVIRLKSSITIAEVALSLHKLNITANTGEGCKHYKSFSSQIPEFDSNQLLECIADISQAPTSKTGWKKLIKLIDNDKNLYPIPVHCQEQVLQALFQLTDAKIMEQVCTALCSSNVLGYRKLQDFSIFCIEHGLTDIISKQIARNQYSENVKVKILDHSLGLEPETGTKILESVLSSGFSVKKITIYCKQLTPDAMLILLLRLLEIYKNFSKENLHFQCLSLIGAILDAGGNQLVVEKKLQAIITELMETVTDFAALSDVFSHLRVGMTLQEPTFEIDTVFRLRRLKIQPRKIVW